jgi:signal transduction histidine kinase
VPDGEAAFRRFHRGTTAAADDGFGLGLAIARELATALGGSLCIDADAAQTTFVLALPAAAAHERRAERPDGSTTA